MKQRPVLLLSGCCVALRSSADNPVQHAWNGYPHLNMRFAKANIKKY
ncbi:hypothetical protein BH10BAC2_BH10BAC2_00030 [soil metagenome]